MSKLNLDLSGVQAGISEVDFVPAGKYGVRISGCALEQNSKKTGHFLKFTFAVVNEQYAGSSLVERYNFDHPNADTKKYALADVKKILIACGHHNPDAFADTDEVIGKTLTLTVGEYEDEWTKDDGEVIKTKKNNVKGYGKFTMDEAIGSPTEAAANTPDASTPDASKKPWE